MNKNNVDNSIFVIGFPKSGNTWLTRLLADCLKARAGSGMRLSDVSEIATSVNYQLRLSKKTEFVIRKTHYLPEVFNNVRNEQIRKAVYIYRDFRDIAISSFFYKFSTINEKLLYKQNNLIQNFIESIKEAINSKKEDFYQNFHTSMEYFNPFKKRSYRNLLLHHTFSLSQGWSEGVGDWSMHIYAWLRFMEKNIDTNFAIVSYENLIEEPFVSLTCLINKLGIPLPSEENVLTAIERQSFENQKSYFQHLDNDQDMPMGKSFNIRFLRKGISGDWKNYYTKEMGRITDKYHGEMLRKLGYVREEKWYRSL